jgi:hypothetical protein
MRETKGVKRVGLGVNASGISIEGAGSGGDVGFGVTLGGSESISIVGVTDARSDLLTVCCVNTDAVGVPEERKVILLADQSINRLKRWSQLYPRTRSLGASRWVTKNSI